MATSPSLSDILPDGFLEVDAARLLLILAKFAHPIDAKARQLSCLPSSPCERHFASEYYLHKLDFLLRYPSYFAYELMDLYQQGSVAIFSNKHEVMSLIRKIIREQEPEFDTIPFRKFWRGAYQRIRNVEAWWLARRLVYVRFELRGDARPWKHYFLTKKALEVTDNLVTNVKHARWYSDRISAIHRFMGHLSASEIKERQYEYDEYRDAQLNKLIPDIESQEVATKFKEVFGEVLE